MTQTPNDAIVHKPQIAIEICDNEKLVANTTADIETVPIEDTAEPPKPETSTEETATKEKSAERAKVISDPVALNKIIPTYPRSARRKGHEGCVMVEVSVAADGHKDIR